MRPGVISTAAIRRDAHRLVSLQSALDKLGFEAPDGSRATIQVPAGGH
jgi:hypothetical protein